VRRRSSLVNLWQRLGAFAQVNYLRSPSPSPQFYATNQSGQEVPRTPAIPGVRPLAMQNGSGARELPLRILINGRALNGSHRKISLNFSNFGNDYGTYCCYGGGDVVPGWRGISEGKSSTEPVQILTPSPSHTCQCV
jgi:hypothetical protein